MNKKLQEFYGTKIWRLILPEKLYTCSHHKMFIYASLTSETRKSDIFIVSTVMDSNTTTGALTQTCGKAGTIEVIQPNWGGT